MFAALMIAGALMAQDAGAQAMMAGAEHLELRASR